MCGGKRHAKNKANLVCGKTAAGHTDGLLRDEKKRAWDHQDRIDSKRIRNVSDYAASWLRNARLRKTRMPKRARAAPAQVAGSGTSVMV